MDNENTKEKNPVGRPFVYGPEILVKTREYLDSCQDEYYQLIKSNGGSSVSYENKLRVKLPSIEGLALSLKIHRDTVYEWEKSYSDFFDLVEELRQRQADVLLSKGLAGDYNPAISKMILSSKHNYVEKVETKHSGEINNPYANLTDEQVRQELARRFEKERRKSGSDIFDGGCTELPEDGKASQASRNVPETSGADESQRSGVDTQKPSENNDGHDSVHNSENS